ncbi:MAG: hypothetical protein ACM368_12890 [Gemmatimonadota bacterium]
MSSDWAPAITMSIIALSVSAAFVLRGPVGRALRILAKSRGADRIGSGT